MCDEKKIKPNVVLFEKIKKGDCSYRVTISSDPLNYVLRIQEVDYPVDKDGKKIKSRNKISEVSFHSNLVALYHSLLRSFNRADMMTMDNHRISDLILMEEENLNLITEACERVGVIKK